MKKRYVVNYASVFAIFILSFFSNPLRGYDLDKEYYEEQKGKLTLFHRYGAPKKEFVDLLSTINIQHNGMRQGVVDAIQERFYTKGEEYFQVKDDSKYPLKTVQPYLEKLGLLREVLPERSVYKDCVILDAGLLWFRERLAMLNKVWQNDKVHFEKLYVCAGDHPFDAGREYTNDDYFNSNLSGLTPNPNFNADKWRPLLKTKQRPENEVLKMLFEQVQLSDRLRERMTWIVSKQDGQGNRPNTQSNAIDFLRAKPKKGHTLVISSGPHIPYQHSVFLYTLHKHKSPITIETIGRKDPGEFNGHQHLKRLAILAYSENMLLNELGVEGQ